MRFAKVMYESNVYPVRVHYFSCSNAEGRHAKPYLAGPQVRGLLSAVKCLLPQCCLHKGLCTRIACAVWRL